MKKYDNFRNMTERKLYLDTNLLVSNNNYIEIDNCKKILEYNDIMIKLETRNMIISIWGNKINMSDYTHNGIIIRGNITSIEFLKK